MSAKKSKRRGWHKICAAKVLRLGLLYLPNLGWGEQGGGSSIEPEGVNALGLGCVDVSGVARQLVLVRGSAYDVLRLLITATRPPTVRTASVPGSGVTV